MDHMIHGDISAKLLQNVYSIKLFFRNVAQVF